MFVGSKKSIFCLFAYSIVRSFKNLWLKAHHCTRKIDGDIDKNVRARERRFGRSAAWRAWGSRQWIGSCLLLPVCEGPPDRSRACSVIGSFLSRSGSLKKVTVHKKA